MNDDSLYRYSMKQWILWTPYIYLLLYIMSLWHGPVGLAGCLHPRPVDNVLIPWVPFSLEYSMFGVLYGARTLCSISHLISYLWRIFRDCTITLVFTPINIQKRDTWLSLLRARLLQQLSGFESINPSKFHSVNGRHKLSSGQHTLAIHMFTCWRYCYLIEKLITVENKLTSYLICPSIWTNLHGV